METLQERLETATALTEADAGLMHDIVHGGPTETVTTEGGAVPSLAKQVADLEAAYAAAGAVAACEAAQTAAETAEDGALAAQAVTEAARDETLVALAQFPIGGGTSISADYVATAANLGDVIEATTSAQAVAVTLPTSDDAVTGNVNEPFWLMVQRSGTNDMTVTPVSPDTIAGGTDPLTIADGRGAKLTLDESVTPHNWIVSHYGAAVGDAEPIGVVKSFFRSAAPLGYLALNGVDFSAATYPDLTNLVVGVMTAAGYTNATAPYFYRHNDLGDPDGNRSETGIYVKCPDWGDRFFRNASDTRLVGFVEEDAMQQITGTVTVAGADLRDETGVFSTAVNSTTSIGGTANATRNSLVFDSSTVVRTDDETRPKAVTLLWCIKAFNSAQTPAEANIEALITEVQGYNAQMAVLAAFIGRTRQDVTASRALDTTYTNDTTVPIEVVVTLASTSGSSQVTGPIATVDGVEVGRSIQYSTTTTTRHALTFTVSPGETYSVSKAGTCALSTWTELRP